MFTKKTSLKSLKSGDTGLFVCACHIRSDTNHINHSVDRCQHMKHHLNIPTVYCGKQKYYKCSWSIDKQALPIIPNQHKLVFLTINIILYLVFSFGEA